MHPSYMAAFLPSELYDELDILTPRIIIIQAKPTIKLKTIS